MSMNEWMVLLWEKCKKAQTSEVKRQSPREGLQCDHMTATWPLGSFLKMENWSLLLTLLPEGARPWQSHGGPSKQGKSQDFI